jgi:hypothetical protein
VNVTANNISTSGGLTANILNFTGGTIGGSANIVFNLAGDLTTTGDATLTINNSTGGMIGADAGINVSAASISAGGALFANIFNSGGGTIVGSAAVNFTLTGDITTTGDANFMIDNHNGGMIGVDAAMNVSAANISTVGSLNAEINNSGGDHIGGSANVAFNLSGQLATQSDTSFTIDNSGGTIGVDAAMNVSATSILTAGSLFANIINASSAGNIVGSANINFNLTGDLTTTGDASFGISNSNVGGGGGTIGSDAVINVTANNVSTGTLNAAIDNSGGTIVGNATINVTAASITANSLLAQIDNSNGGSIGSGANVTLNVGGDLTTQGDATFQILNFDLGGGPGTIGVDATVNVTANNISIGGAFEASVINFGGAITGNATVDVTAGNITTGGIFDSRIVTQNGASIGGDAAINLTANTLSVGNLQSTIENFDGIINGSANINFNLTGDLTTQGDAFTAIENAPGGTIGSNATVNVTANNISTGNLSASIMNSSGTTIGLDAAVNVSAASILTVGTLNAEILNGAGTIGGSASLNFILTGDLTTSGDANFLIDNSNGGGVGTIGSNATVNVTANNISSGGNLGFTIANLFHPCTIGGNATINVTAANITANSLLAQIANTNGTIGGNAAINMNVSGNATIANDATFQILGSDGAAAAAINFNNGSYDVGGTFLSRIDGNETLTFNNASAHADVLKAGVFGTSGVLNVGGGVLSADTTLKLYAPGSIGELNFVSNVTLTGNSAKILAANSVTIFNNIVVIIGGPNPADVFTNNANYTGFGGNGTTTGTFAGAGANNPQPLVNAPPFGASPIATRTRIPPPSPSNVLTGGKIADVRRANNVINVRSSDELLTLLDDAAPGPGGKITIPPSKITNNSRHSSRVDPAGRLNPVSRLNADRRAMDMRTTSSSLMRRSPQ